MKSPFSIVAMVITGVALLVSAGCNSESDSSSAASSESRVALGSGDFAGKSFYGRHNDGTDKADRQQSDVVKMFAPDQNQREQDD